MHPRPSPSPFTLPRAGFLILCLLLASVVLWANARVTALHANNALPNLPYGVFLLPDRTLLAQDFSYNLLFLKGVQARLVRHPYRLADQAEMTHRLLPLSQSGMSHAYSPVVLVVALPLLALSGHDAYLVSILIGAAGLLLLYYFCLMPLMKTRLQVYAFLVCVMSYGFVSAVTLGQSVLVTTALLGWLWYLLKNRDRTGSIWSDALIATLFWALCLKPNVAFVPLVLLMGQEAWRPMAIAGLMLLVTWFFVADYYGGDWAGLADYFQLLNHYNNAEFPSYLQRGAESRDSARMVRWLFELNRSIVLAVGALLVVLRWARRITPAQLFQGMVGNFLLFSPYVLGTEIFIVCLLVVEGSFFRSKHPLLVGAKLLLLAVLFNLHENLPFYVGLLPKWTLFLWIVAEGAPRQWAARSTTSCGPAGAVAA